MASFSGIVKGVAAGVESQAKQNAAANINSVKKTAKDSLVGAKDAAIKAAFPALLKGDIGSVLDAVAGAGSAAPGNPFAGINAREDAMQTQCWFCVPPSLADRPSAGAKKPSLTDKLIGAATNIVNNALGFADSDGKTLPWYYVEAATLTFRTFTSQQIYREGRNISVPKGYEVPNITLTFMLDDTGKAMAYLREWQSLVMQNPPVEAVKSNFLGLGGSPKTGAAPGTWGRPYGAKGFYRDIPFHVLTVNSKEVLTITYKDCWPLDIGQLSLVSDASDRIKVEITFAVNDVQWSVAKPTNALDKLFEAGKSKLIGFGMKTLKRVI